MGGSAQGPSSNSGGSWIPEDVGGAIRSDGQPAPLPFRTQVRQNVLSTMRPQWAKIPSYSDYTGKPVTKGNASDAMAYGMETVFPQALDMLRNQYRDPIAEAARVLTERKLAIENQPKTLAATTDPVYRDPASSNALYVPNRPMVENSFTPLPTATGPQGPPPRSGQGVPMPDVLPATGPSPRSPGSGVPVGGKGGLPAGAGFAGGNGWTDRPY